MNDAFDLPAPKDNPAPVVEPQLKAPEQSHKSVTEALQYLTQLKARCLTYEGRDNMNPHLWIHNRGVDKVMRGLTKEPTTQLVEEAFQIHFEEPNINLFTADYEPTKPISKSHGM